MNFTLVINYFLWEFLPVLCQLYLCEAIFIIGFHRKPVFALRAAVGTVAAVAAVFLFSLIYYYISAVPILGSSIIYLALFMVTVVQMKFCFNEPFIHLLFAGVSGYATQNLGYVVYAIFWRIGWDTGWWVAAYDSGMDLALLYQLMATFASILAAVAAYFLFARRMRRETVRELYSPNVLAISFALLSVSIVFCSVTNTYAGWITTLYAFCMGFCGMFCLAVLTMQAGMLERSRYRRELSVVNSLLAEEKSQYEISKETIEIINIKCHDLRHRVREVRKNSMDCAELKEIEKAISIYDSGVKTENETLDVVLTEKSLLCENNDIKLVCMADGSKLSFMSAPDIYSLFGNIVENALEATVDLEDKSKRIINLIIKSRGNMLFIQAENYYEGETEFVGGLPRTTKGDVSYHGFGLKSVKMIVTKYGGDLAIDASGGTFRVNIAFPLS